MKMPRSITGQPAKAMNVLGWSDHLSPELAAFMKFLKKRGQRYTKEREAIAREIISNSDHFDVDELFIRLRRTAGVSKASIYRTIPLLIEAGLLMEVYLEDGHMHYEHVYGREQHSHLRCVVCRKIFEFNDSMLAEIEKKVAVMHNFQTEGHKFEIWGRCADCQSRD